MLLRSLSIQVNVKLTCTNCSWKKAPFGGRGAIFLISQLLGLHSEMNRRPTKFNRKRILHCLTLSSRNELDKITIYVHKLNLSKKYVYTVWAYDSTLHEMNNVLNPTCCRADQSKSEWWPVPLHGEDYQTIIPLAPSKAGPIPKTSESVLAC